MRGMDYSVDLEAVSQRLLDISRAQARALESDDFAEFDRLSSKRDDLQGMLDDSPPTRLPNGVAAILEEVLAVDSATTRLIGELSAETSDAVSRTQRAHNALIGYGRPAAEPSSSILDTQR
jgi:hypothetical protein